ncbi:hypothetical protein EDM53_04395 [Rickettsiales endosymbiont of Peranema trichophorum]|uniref:hypothetical protein n=1 Tax=Rickettsiales endosymbiont of Peranema trichophorum TaxID=2486577 RepID=UPI001023D53E|nr:hypothetical protein [Rickettsiales endosymbiont of Peranema trichophorum]RZI46025.1 hypothetical protein EDM53_04395 [Rickettsiales endosymbiont of Peranema trichophorum]
MLLRTFFIKLGVGYRLYFSVGGALEGVQGDTTASLPLLYDLQGDIDNGLVRLVQIDSKIKKLHKIGT